MAGKSKDTASALKVEVLPLWTALLLDALSGPDDELGGLLLGILIQTRAQELGIPVNEITEDDCEQLIEYFKSCETSTAKHAAFEKAVHLAAAGDFETAGQFIREHLNDGAESIAWKNLGKRFVPAGIRKLEQAREFGERGGSVKRQQGQKNREAVLDAAERIIETRKNSRRPTGRELAPDIAQQTGLSESAVRRHLTKASLDRIWQSRTK